MDRHALSKLSIAEREQLLKIARAKLAQKSTSLPPIEPTDRSGLLPLSNAQQRLWFLTQLDTNASEAYHMPIGLRIAGALDRDALVWALNRLVERHETLRTTFVVVDGEPRQRIAARQPFALDERNLEACVDADDQVQAIIAQEATRPYDVEAGPLIRGVLIRIAQDDHVLLINQHHIVSDGWSMGIIVDEVGTLYAARCRGEADPLPPLRIQYADYAAWQRSWFDEAMQQRQADYWEQTLTGAPGVLDLPGDRPRPAQQNYEGGSVDCELGAGLSRGLRELSQRHGATLFMTLMAGWAVLVARLSGQQDLVIGTPSANRNHREVESLIGFFVNMLPLRFDLSNGPTVAELIAQVKQRSIEAQNHQDLPFEQVVERLNPTRSLAFHPLFQLVFAWQNAPNSGDLDSVGVAMETLPAPHVTSRFDMLLSLNDNGGAVVGKLEYATSLFDESTVLRYLDQWRMILQGMVDDEAAEVDSLPMLGERERTLMLHDWNRVATQQDERPVHAYFEDWASRQPDAVAASHGERSLTYGELNRKANRLAHHLRALGVRAEDRVALCFERGLSKLVAILAVFKAGAGYVPLDPAYPAERLDFVLEDSAPKVMITDSTMSARWRGTDDPPAFELIEIDRDAAWAHLPADDLPLPSIGWRPDNLAYVIYTSGSTGKPKGVMIEHRSISRLFTSTAHWYDFNERDVWPLFHSYAFDVAVWEMWGAFRHGGRLVVIDMNVARAPDEYYALVCREGVTVLNQTPSAFRQFDQAQGNSPVAHALRYVIFAGETLEVASLRAWYGRERNARTKLVNMYGITEGTVHCTYYAVQPGDVERIGPSPIGKRIPDLRTYILDSRRQPVPMGVTGELYVGGPGIARGYLNRPDLTAERFIEDPFCGVPGERLYKSGDLARFCADGSIEYQGRNDFQVKIRGYRIELGEIEARLHAHPAVREVAVIAREDHPGEKQLVAYVALDEEYEAKAPAALDDAQVDGWEDLYDTTYGDSPDAVEVSDFVGWNSSYTGEPIPLAHMGHWRDETVARIRAHGPRRVLEIGCGTGLLLLPLAGECERYVGSDLSRRALANLETKTAALGLDNVQLVHARANDFSAFGEERFDTIVVNSVVQYFPNLDYLESVLESAFARLTPGGRLFIGDVRNLCLLEAFHGSVQRHRADADARIGDLRERTSRAIETEGELLLDPAYFVALAKRLGGHVQVLLKAGDYHNELTRFRYDVVLQSGTGTVAPMPVALDWAHDCGAPGRLAATLEAQAGRVVAFRGLRNARLCGECDTMVLLHDADRASSDRLPEPLVHVDPAAVDPQALLDAAQAAGWHAELSWCGTDASGDYHAILYPTGMAHRCDHAAVFTSEPGPRRSLANDPLRSIKRAKTAEALRMRLQAELPAHMVPAHIMLIDHLPMTTNGKLDRKALPPPEIIRNDVGFVAPRTPVEQEMAQIWATVLKIDRVGIHDNFFALGGDSILTVAIIARAREHGVALRIEHVFKHQTIAALADNGLLEHGGREPLRVEEAPAPVYADLPADVEDAFGLSALQLGMVYHSELAQASGVYHDVFSFHLRLREWNLGHFRTVLDALARKHPILRTSFDLQGADEPCQRVHRQAQIPIAVEDLTSLSSDAADAAVSAFIEREKANGFDLTQPPLLRVFVHLRGAHEVQYTLSFHHAVLDGWSVAAFHSELFREYVALCGTGARELELAPLGSTFKATVTAERRALASAQTRDFWRQSLADWTPLMLPRDLDGLGAHSSGGLHLDFPGPLRQALAALASELSVPLRTVLLAAHLRVIAQMSGSDDVITGAVTHARAEERDGAEVLGMFLNTLPHRQRLSDSTWRGLIRETFQTELAIAPHRAYPYFQLFLDNGRVGYHDVVFNYVNFHVLADVERSSDIQLLGSTGAGATNFELALTAVASGDSLSLGLEYDRGRYTQARAQQFLERHIEVLKAMVAAPDAPHWSCDCQPPGEIEAVLCMGRTQAPTGDGFRAVHARFEDWARRSPQAIAVVHGGRELSYAELDRHANRLARRLRDLGVQPDDAVALYLDRGLPWLVAMLATLKAGAAYLPLDLASPPERLARLLEDSAPKVLITDSALDGRWQTSAARKPPFAIVRMDADAAWNRCCGEPLDPLAQAAHLAYLIYTSGSTGAPKGVEVEHGALSVRMDGLSALYGFHAQDRVLQFASPGFDASVEEVFGALCNGATLVLRDDAWLTGAGEFWSLCESHGISVVDLPTRFWASLCRDRDVALPDCVRLVIVGGEAMEPQMLADWAAHPGPLPRLLDTYGPTEAVVVATAHVCDRMGHDALRIGTPVAGTQAYVLDARRRPVPIGVRGELYLGGAALARGYMNLPQLSAQRFLPDPFAGEPSARMYRTGDLARWRADGTLEYLGRNDQQVKIRGFRVEPGEIEARLSACEGVAEAAVVVSAQNDGPPRLVAYVVPREGAALSVPALRSTLVRDLAEYMIPAAFVCLDALPLTPGGKVDRNALPAPEAAAMEARIHEAPVGATEERLATIWAELLGLERVGRNDNFFESGGHSLLAIRLASILKTRLGRNVALATLFAAPTLAAQAIALDEEPAPALLVPLQNGPGTPLYCVHPVGGHVNVYRSLAQRLAGVGPVFGVQSPEVAGMQEPPPSIEAMARAYGAAIRAAQPQGPYRLLGWSTGGLMAMAVARYLQMHGGEVDYLGLVDSRSTFVDAEPTSARLTDEAAWLELRGAGYEWTGRAGTSSASSVGDWLAQDFETAAATAERWGLQPALTAEAFEHLCRQVAITRHHLRLFAQHRPAAVGAPTQVFHAAGIHTAGRPAATWPQAAQTVAVEADHYALLSPPHVDGIAAAIAAFLRSPASGRTAASTADDAEGALA